jgi:hypothetical protein
MPKYMFEEPWITNYASKIGLPDNLTLAKYILELEWKVDSQCEVELSDLARLHECCYHMLYDRLSRLINKEAMVDGLLYKINDEGFLVVGEPES